jgi:hypothetical protein
MSPGRHEAHTCNKLPAKRLLLNSPRGILVSLAMLSLIPFFRLSAQGSRVTLRLSGGAELTGEILYARKDALLLSTGVARPEEKLIKHPDEFRKVDSKGVRALKFLGVSHVLDGITLGFIGGICIGCLMAFEPTPHGNSDFSTSYDAAGMGVKALVIFAGVGTALGYVTGTTTSTKDLEIDVGRHRNFNYFKQFSRYQEEEPDFLIQWESTLPEETEPPHSPLIHAN